MWDEGSNPPRPDTHSAIAKPPTNKTHVFQAFRKKKSRTFSPAVRVGNLLFLAGQIGTDASGKVVAGGIQAEARQALNNIKDVLEKSGSSMDRVAKCTVFMADMKEWPAMNEIYATYFRRSLPARSAFGATGLALNARVEIECVAVMG